MKAIDSEHSSITFRNYLTYSFSEEIKPEIFIDDEFYVSSVLTISEYYSDFDTAIQTYSHPKTFYIVSEKERAKDLHSE